MTGRLIHHLALPQDWVASFGDGEYTMSTRGRSLDDEGFIHCATPEQVEGVADRFYADIDQLVLLTIDTDAVDAEVREEPAVPGGAERFPHLYGPLPLAAVVDARLWFRSPNGWTLDSL